jgi:hypothetical protein
MDQPYSRIADALLDYQYWSPNDPQKTPYDDTGWTFPEGFNTQAIRVTDPKVLDAAMTVVRDTVRAPGGVTGAGSVVAIAANGDVALTTLRYRLKGADIQAAEDTFSVDGKKFARGSFLVRGVPAADLDRATKELGLAAVALAAAPNVKTHPVRAARVALMHTWLSTQTEGWWRQALDYYKIPYDYISTQDVAKIPSLAAKYDVILFAPGGGSGQQIVDGIPQWRNAMPWKVTAETPNMTSFAQTDDIRPGLGWQGMAKLQAFVQNGGVFVGVNNSAEFATQFGLAQGVTMNHPRRGVVTGSLLRTKLVDDASPITYGIADGLAVYSDAGESFSVSAGRGGRGNRFGGGGGGRETGRGTSDDPDVPQGRPVLDPKNEAPKPETVQPWETGTVSLDAMRNPTYVIPPDQRPRVALRFSDQRELLVSGLLDGGGDIAQRPAVVDVPVQKGHVVLFANNPIYRGSTIGSYALVFNTMLHWDNLNAGRKLDAR